MFDFKNGMLGVTIVALALAGAVVGGYLAGIEAVEKEVTRYDFLADISGLYEYDQSPQYIDYDPSSNYTGYYSDNSFSQDTNKYYFAEDEVAYTPNSSVNNYKVDLEPIIDAQATQDLSDLSMSSVSGTFRVNYCYDDEHGDVSSWHNVPVYTLDSVISAMAIDGSKTNLRISFGNVNWDSQPASTTEYLTLNTILIIPSTQFTSVGNQTWTWVANPNLDIEVLKDKVGRNDIYEPYQSFDIDLKSRIVTPYYNADFTEPGNSTYLASSYYVCFGYYQQAVPKLILSEDMSYRTMTTKIDYLNPNYGVQMKDGGA